MEFEVGYLQFSYLSAFVAIATCFVYISNYIDTSEGCRLNRAR